MARKPVERKITNQDFNKLLLLLDSDSETAAAKYELERLKLTSYFRWHAAENPEELADQTLDRVLLRLSEGGEIKNLHHYSYAVARNLRIEAAEARRKKERVLSELARESVVDNPFREERLKIDETRLQARLRCLRFCLMNLLADDRDLVLRYYQSESGGKSASRQMLADELGIPLNALRIRAFRAKMKLGNCIQKCLGK